MDIHGIPIGSLWTILNWLPGVVLRRFFPTDRLAQLIYFDLQPRHRSAMINLGEVANYEVYFQLINLSPFEVELDRAKFDVYCAGTVLQGIILKKQRFAPGEISSIFIDGSIPDGHANQIARNMKPNEADMSVDGNMEFNCKLQPFAKRISNLSGIAPKVYNADHRRK